MRLSLILVVCAIVPVADSLLKSLLNSNPRVGALKTRADLGYNDPGMPKTVIQQQRDSTGVRLRHVLVTPMILATAGMVAASNAAEDPMISRSDVGMINLNETMPDVTNVCWLDISVGESPSQRVEISLFGKVAPRTAANFKALAKGEPGWGYTGSEIFRIISTFSVQGGNINANPGNVLQSQLGKEGKSAFGGGEPFPAENYRILHGAKDAGVVSMMKDLSNRGLQDSRFFITLSPDASWADDRYVAFGLVTKGMDFVRGLSILPTTPPANYPNTRIRIVSSGVY